MTLKELLSKLAKLMTVDAAQRDEKAIADVLNECTKAIETDEQKSAEEKRTEKSQIEQLRADLDAVSQQIRSLKAGGLGITRSGGAILLDVDQRVKMLHSRRAWSSDETAKRFGALMATRLAAASNHERFSTSMLPRSVRDLADQVRKDMNISPEAGSGAELMSDEFRPELIRNVEAVGQAFPLCRRVPLNTRGTSTFPKRTGGLTAYPTAVGAKIEQSGMTFDTVTLTPVPWATLTGIPLVMFEDPGLLIDLGNLIGVEIAYAMAYAFDDAVINGDGSADYGEITGLLNSASIADAAPTEDHDIMTEIDAADISEIIGLLTADYAHPEAQWLMSLSVKAYLRNLRSTDGHPIYDRGNSRDPATIDGYPYTICNRMPAAANIGAAASFALFGDFKLAMYFGMIRDIRIERSDHLWFDRGLVAIRGLAEVDAAVADGAAVIDCQTHA